MTASIPQGYRHLLALLAHSVLLRDETKAAIIDINADIADCQQQLTNTEHLLTAAQQARSVTKRWHANAINAVHTDRLACLDLAKRLLEAHLQTIDGNYLELENDLKEKIIEVSGGDDSLFAVYVPSRPGDFYPA